MSKLQILKELVLSLLVGAVLIGGVFGFMWVVTVIIPDEVIAGAFFAIFSVLLGGTVRMARKARP